MKKKLSPRLIAQLAAIPVLMITACSSPMPVIPTQIPTASPSASPLPSITSTRQILPATKTPVPIAMETAITAPTFTPSLPTLQPEVQFELADGIEEAVFIQGYEVVGGGVWSPARDEIAFYQRGRLKDAHTDTDFIDYSLILFNSPTFMPRVLHTYQEQQIFGSSDCSPISLLWSQDGKQIFFDGPTAEGTDTYLYDCAAWISARDGKFSYQVQPEHHGRELSFEGWMDNATMVTSKYVGGGATFIRIWDSKRGKVKNAAFVDSPFSSFLNRNYVAGTQGRDFGFTAFALKNVDKGQPLDQMDLESVGLTYATLIPYHGESDKSGLVGTIAVDWQPGTNQMLAYASEIAANGFDDIEKLVLWDVDRGSVQTIAADGVSGKFSPDGQILVYMTKHPISKDPEGATKDPAAQEEGFHPYAHIVDMNTGQTLFSFPITTRQDENVREQFFPNMSFSSDSRYLAFLSDRKITPAENGSPTMSQPVEEGKSLSILDLQTLQIVSSTEDVTLPPQAPIFSAFWEISHVPTWSPVGHKLFYRDQNENLMVLDVDKGTITPITKHAGGDISAKWSHSGKYLAIEVPVDNEDHINVAFVQVP